MARNKKQTDSTAVAEVDELEEILEEETEETEETEARKSLRPSDLADLTGADPKQIRGWLRANFPRPKEMKGKSWDIPLDAWDAAVEHFTPAEDADEEVDAEELEEIEA